MPMALKLPYPTNESQGATNTLRPRLTAADIVVFGGVLALLYILARLGAGVTAPFGEGTAPQISLDPTNLPYYAARSLLRMFAALGASLLFTLVYGYAAAKSRRLERVLIPLLDILQSVPVLGFLSITVTGFIALFPGSLLGLECASIFAIFTSQAWNMTFSFFSSLRTLPREMDEAARIFRLGNRQRFWKIEVPFATIGLVWNGMMSFGGGWFFLAASEAISVLNQRYTLPGVGSYLAGAVTAQDFGALGWALLTMIIMIVVVDQLFWRPLVAWSEKFKMEDTQSAEGSHSWVLDILRRSSLARLPGMGIRRFGDWLAALAALVPRKASTANTVGRADQEGQDGGRRQALLGAARANRDRIIDWLFYGALAIVAAWVLYNASVLIWTSVGPGGVLEVLGLGLLTLLRVVVLVALASIVWVPIGVWIGFNPRVSRVMQPIVQILASFPANFLFPFVTILLLNTGFPIDIGAVFLMSLGAQWYILFNTISGATSIPNDLREAARIFRVKGWQLWRTLIIPGIFGYWVTGGITAMGGAWNASIVAEIVGWGDKTLTAHGLGAYIAQATTVGDWPRIFLGVGVMSIYVVGINRLFWRRLYSLAETRFKLGN
jgi:NitT/TauT family transport system permease protein